MGYHNNKNLLKSSGVIFVLCVTLTSCGFLRNSKAIEDCKSLVKDRLSSPSTAEFLEVKFNNLDGMSFEIVGEFDAQNGFGAMLRGSFKCMGFQDEELRLIYVQ